MALPTKTFQKKIYSYYQKNGRDLPWRRRITPYRVFVSEVMLQQTQVSAVEKKFHPFVKRFPSFRKLAESNLRDVLSEWSGLGYNRRGLHMHRAAQMIVREQGGRLPLSTEELEALPGIGQATACSIAAFAFNQPVVFIETNIRSVYIHHFFPKRHKVKDEELLPLIERTLDRENPRQWYSALMDYGSGLKQKQDNPGRRSTAYARQSRFEGSLRQVRGAVLKELTRQDRTPSALHKALPYSRKKIDTVLDKMAEEGLLAVRSRRYSIA